MYTNVDKIPRDLSQMLRKTARRSKAPPKETFYVPWRGQIERYRGMGGEYH
jgi:hypothetical protein